MKLIDTIEAGNFKGLGKPDFVIETLISKLFFFDTTVYKIYKHVPAFFGDFNSHEFRLNFFKEDFIWNNTFSPTIYLQLEGYRQIGDIFTPCSIDDADEWCIVMNKIDNTKTLMNLLSSGVDIADEDLIRLTEILVDRLRTLTATKKNELAKYFNAGWPELQKEDLEDLRQWAYMVEQHIPKSTTDTIVDSLLQASQVDPYIINYDSTTMSVATDNHAGNILVDTHEIGFIDIMPPKENWRVADEVFSISRPATDVAVFLGKKKADLMYQVYSKRAKPFPDSIRVICDIRSAFIQAAYLFMLNKNELAQKYMNFIEQSLPSLQK